MAPITALDTDAIGRAIDATEERASFTVESHE